MSKILVIDDEEDIVRVLSISLRSDGHAVVAACSGEEGLAAFEKESPDLVLTDIKMPGMDGIAVLRAIKARQPDAEVIIVTGHGDIENAVEALKFGASDFINKPVRDEALAVAIQRAEEKRTIKRQLREYTETLEHKVKLATEELRRQSNFLSKLIRSSNDGIIATDKTRRVVIFNPGAEHIFGYTAEEIVPRRSIEELLAEEVIALFSSAFLDRRAAGELAWKETAIRAKDGTAIPVRCYASPLYEKQELMGTVFFFQDLREIKRLEAELLNAERLAAIGQTVAGVAHGVKNILHGFKGGSYLVDLGIANSDTLKLKQGWEMIKRNIGRTSGLVMDLLAYSKERTPEYAPCDPNAIVRDVCDVMQDLADQHHVRLATELDAGLGTVLLDRHSMHQILANLVSNAIDACLFDEDVLKQWQVQVQATLDGDRQLCFTVSDNGAGMSVEVKAKLFTSFFSTKGHRGTGLGLLVTRKLVQEQGGTISVTSEPGQGTRFTIRLPYRPAPPGGGDPGAIESIS